MPERRSSDRNLLFGIIALQMDFITRQALIAAMNAWVLDKHKPLDRILLEQNALRGDDHVVLAALVHKHIANHGNDANQSLAALSSVDSIKNDLKKLADPDVDASIAYLPRGGDVDPSATRDVSLDTLAAVGLRYRILRPHAKGNLGEVFVAQDAELHREVALKEIQGYHADHPETRARFILEAEITGGLEHPGIVPVYGLGTYADGRPFYAMRFIKGDNLKEAIERFHARDVAGRDPVERHLAYLQLLRRFIDVCNAIAYAHARGILHRDLKPGNIMLGKYGETLVVDWGLAKAVDRPDLATHADERALEPSSGSSAAMTQAGMVVGTPAYMSPEQAAGRLDELGPASDIYSLGATLYCVLTGTSPVSGTDAGEVLRKVQRGDITQPRQIKRDIPAALEAVCLKAMAVKPGDRYKSALDLAADLEHWLADEPVAAYQEGWWERGRRWVRRHRTLATSAAATLVVAVLLLSGAAVLLNTARQREEQARLDEEVQRKEAEKQERQATAVADLLVKSFRKPDPSVDGREVKVVEVLEQALKELDHEAHDDATTARLVDALGLTFLGLGLPGKAIPLHERARRLRSHALGAEHSSTLTSMHNLASAFKDGGQLSEALPLFEETRKLRTAKLGLEHRDTLASMNGLAATYKDSGRLTEALLLFEQTLKLREATLGPEHSDTLETVNDLALAYKDIGRLSEALPLLEKTLRLNRAKRGLDHPETLGSMNNLASAYQESGRLTEALPLREETLKLCQIKFGPDHPYTLISMNNLARIYQDAGRLTEALPLFTETLKLITAKFGADHLHTIGSMNNLADAYRVAGRLDEALPLFIETLGRSKAKLGNDHPLTVAIMDNLARAYQAHGQFPEAQQLFEETLELRKVKLGPAQRDTVVTMTGLAQCLIQQGKFAQAETHLREVVSIHERTQPGDWQCSMTQSLLGAALAGQKKYTDAEPLLISGYEGLRARGDKNPELYKRELPDALNRIIDLYEAWPKPDKAAEWSAKRAGLKQAAERPER